MHSNANFATTISELARPTAVYGSPSLSGTSLTLASTLQLQRAAHALGLASARDVCKLMPEQEVGLYYIADEMIRADTRATRSIAPRTPKTAFLGSQHGDLATAHVDWIKPGDPTAGLRWR